MNNNPQYYSGSNPVIELDEQARGAFISRTYMHLFSAISAFVLIEIALFQSGLADTIVRGLLGVSWLWVLGGFLVVSWLARGVAHSVESKALQYAALAGYVIAEAI